MEQSTIAIARRENTVPESGLGAGKNWGRGSILIADEDASLANFLSQELQCESFEVEVVHDGEAALDALQEERRHDLVILDLNLPRLDGMSLIQRVRPEKPRLPMLVLTARSRVEDKVLAFQSGADDFMVKPFSFAELLARVNSLMRRHARVVPNLSEVGDLRLYREEHRVERNGRRIDLTPREFSIVDYMLQHVGRPVSRAMLFEDVWKVPHQPSTNIVDVYMKYVRDKVDGPGERKLTHTVRGIGYEFRDG
ncbi:response regulator transcription factor [Granulicella sp. L46]|uniref:response regulator transcription factor n=1 Tax=Granulicella sp. L46 TaxID=1641865 RepID=UPI00131D7A5D|nr:response regulator transcription factor [Granulicella sp. L46]